MDSRLEMFYSMLDEETKKCKKTEFMVENLKAQLKSLVRISLVISDKR